MSEKNTSQILEEVNPVFTTTEGMLMYFAQPELEEVFSYA